MSEILSSSAGGNLGICGWGLGLQFVERLLDPAGFEVIRIGWGNRGLLEILARPSRVEDVYLVYPVLNLAGYQPARRLLGRPGTAG